MFNRSIFSWQAEGVPTDWMQYIKALHAFIACHGITQTVIPDMTHMQVAGWVGKHDQTKISWAFIGFRGAINARFIPTLLPFGFNFLC